MTNSALIKIDAIRELTKKLPKAVRCCQFGSAKFEIYRAKNLFSKKWVDPVLKALVIEARKSYCRYGDTLPLDEYDTKSAIYLVRAIYPKPASRGNVEEWLSTRLVPASGHPDGIEDLSLFSFSKYTSKESWPVHQLIKEKLFNGSSWKKYLVASSRTCGIKPFWRSGNGVGALDSGNKHTPICFALIHRQFVEDYKTSELPYRYFVGTVIDKFVDKALTLELKGQKFAPAFTSAYQTLGLSSSKFIKINRKTNDFYAYRFSTYFLNFHQLINCFQSLCRTNQLTNETFFHYSGLRGEFQRLLGNNELSIEKFSFLSKLLTVRGKIMGSAFTGAELRDLVAKMVEDGPELKITKGEVWFESIKQLLIVAKNSYN